MEEQDVSIGIKEDLYRGVLDALESEDRKIVEGYSPNDITVDERIGGYGMRWHDARYLWMRLLRSTGKKDFGPTMHKFSRVTVIREDAVLEAVNGLRLEQRQRLLHAIDQEQNKHRKRRGKREAGADGVIADIEWDGGFSESIKNVCLPKPTLTV